MKANVCRLSTRTALGSAWARAASPSCCASRQWFSATATAQAGHNKWSKTKHIKAVTDRKKMAERTSFGKLIAMHSRREFVRSVRVAHVF